MNQNNSKICTIDDRRNVLYKHYTKLYDTVIAYDTNISPCEIAGIFRSSWRALPAILTTMLNWTHDRRETEKCMVVSRSFKLFQGGLSQIHEARWRNYLRDQAMISWENMEFDFDLSTRGIFDQQSGKSWERRGAIPALRSGGARGISVVFSALLALEATARQANDFEGNMGARAF